MKKVFAFIVCILVTTFSFSQKIEKTVKKYWWDVQQACFTGTSVTKTNGMFMSTAQNIPVGATFKLKKSICGKVNGASLDLTYASIKKELSCFPDKVDSATATPPCSFDLQNTRDYQLEIAAKLSDQSNIGKINADLQRILKEATALNLAITSWGFEILEQGKIELCFRSNYHNDFANFLRNGKRYIVLTAIWIDGIKLDYKLDNETITKIKTIYESNKQAFINAGVTLDFQSTTLLTSTFKYDQRFYPFYRFGRITKEGEIKGIVDVIIEEPNFLEYNNK